MKNVKIVKVYDIEKANAITHSGSFHADEVMSTVLISKLIPQVNVCRTPKIDPDKIASDAIIYDIGGGEFDHHQRNFCSARPNGIKYSSFGLLWKNFGMQLLSNVDDAKLVFDIFDKSFVCGIDAVDNGQLQRNTNVQVMTVSGVISEFNPNWDENVDPDECFLKAVQFAEAIFDNAFEAAISKAKAKNKIEAAIENSKNSIMVLDQFMPWQDFLYCSTNEKSKEILYVVFPSNRVGYNVYAVPDSPGSFHPKKPLPKNWAGLYGSKFAEASGVPNASFCHPGRFICGAVDFKSALKLAKLAVVNS